MNSKKKICFLDTEFNAFDYQGQNDNVQEITEIGAVIFENGKIVDKFSRYCLLKPGHKLSRRSKKITNITAELLAKQGIPFNQAMLELKAFLEKNNTNKIYAFGPADAIEMRATAKLNRSGKDIYNLIKTIKNVYPIFQNRLSLHYAFSLMDICRICFVNHGIEGRAHDALNDAEDTGLAYYNLNRNKIDKTLLNEINTHKYNVKIYRMNRSVKMANVKRPRVVTRQFIDDMEIVFENASKTLDAPIVLALHDDMMRLIGRPDLERGEEWL